ncbi:phage tail protein [Streptomyces olivoreticuli]
MNSPAEARGARRTTGDYLPAVYQDDPAIQAFADAIDSALHPVTEHLNTFPSLLDPWQTPPEYLDWLAHISGARTEPGWPLTKKRAAIDLAAWLAARRGTPEALRIEAALVYGWGLTLSGPSSEEKEFVVHVDQVPPEDQDTDPSVFLDQLKRLILAHCPPHVAYRIEGIAGGHGIYASFRTEPDNEETFQPWAAPSTWNLPPELRPTASLTLKDGTSCLFTGVHVFIITKNDQGAAGPFATDLLDLPPQDQDTAADHFRSDLRAVILTTTRPQPGDSPVPVLLLAKDNRIAYRPVPTQGLTLQDDRLSFAPDSAWVFETLPRRLGPDVYTDGLTALSSSTGAGRLIGFAGTTHVIQADPTPSGNIPEWNRKDRKWNLPQEWEPTVSCVIVRQRQSGGGHDFILLLQPDPADVPALFRPGAHLDYPNLPTQPVPPTIEPAHDLWNLPADIAPSASLTETDGTLHLFARNMVYTISPEGAGDGNEQPLDDILPGLPDEFRDNLNAVVFLHQAQLTEAADPVPAVAVFKGPNAIAHQLDQPATLSLTSNTDWQPLTPPGEDDLTCLFNTDRNLRLTGITTGKEIIEAATFNPPLQWTNTTMQWEQLPPWDIHCIVPQPSQATPPTGDTTTVFHQTPENPETPTLTEIPPAWGLPSDLAPTAALTETTATGHKLHLFSDGQVHTIIFTGPDGGTGAAPQPPIDDVLPDLPPVFTENLRTVAFLTIQPADTLTQHPAVLVTNGRDAVTRQVNTPGTLDFANGSTWLPQEGTILGDPPEISCLFNSADNQSLIAITTDRHVLHASAIEAPLQWTPDGADELRWANFPSNSPPHPPTCIMCHPS